MSFVVPGIDSYELFHIPIISVLNRGCLKWFCFCCGMFLKKWGKKPTDSNWA